MTRIEYRVCADPDCPEISEQKLCAQHRPRGRASRSPTTRAQNAEYYRERARVLEPDAAGLRPLCHWGCGAVATTADHLVDVADGGGHAGNLVPSCAPCNARRGGQSRQRRRRSMGGEGS